MWFSRGSLLMGRWGVIFITSHLTPSRRPLCPPCPLSATSPGLLFLPPARVSRVLCSEDLVPAPSVRAPLRRADGACGQESFPGSRVGCARAAFQLVRPRVCMLCHSPANIMACAWGTRSAPWEVTENLALPPKPEQFHSTEGAVRVTATRGGLCPILLSLSQ